MKGFIELSYLEYMDRQRMEREPGFTPRPQRLLVNVDFIEYAKPCQEDDRLTEVKLKKVFGTDIYYCNIGYEAFKTALQAATEKPQSE